jgi:hypothetical protein
VESVKLRETADRDRRCAQNLTLRLSIPRETAQPGRLPSLTES